MAAEPIRVGFSMALTGGVAPIGKQVLAALQIWRDDVNAKGGLLGRPVELVFYDDQSNPANVPGIYTKLIDVDKVDLLIGPYATNMVAPAIPVLMQNKKTTIGILANAANSKFHYDQYFSMLPTGPEPQKAFAHGFFELAAGVEPRPRTVALVAADAEFAQNAVDGARQSIKEIGGFETMFDKSYPPATSDFTPILRGVQALNPDLVYRGGLSAGLGRHRARRKRNRAYAEDVRRRHDWTSGHADQNAARPADERDRQQRGVRAGAGVHVRRHQGAVGEVPGERQGRKESTRSDGRSRRSAYAAGQVLAQAVDGAKSLDHKALADYMRSHTFHTVVGDITFGKDGEWAKSRVVFTQFQERDRQLARFVHGHDPRGRRLAEGIQVGQHDLPVCEGEEPVANPPSPAET